MRNTPLLLQLLFWYALSQALPGTHDALNPLPGVFLSNRGLFLPGLALREGFPWLGGRLAVAIEYPALVGFNFRGGLSVSPEFAALLIGLSTLHGGVHRRDRPRRDPRGRPRPDRGRSGARVVPRQDSAARRPAAGAAGDHAADDQPVPEPAEELVACRGDRLSGPDFDHQHHAQSDRAGHRGDHAGGDDLYLAISLVISVA